MDDPLPNPVNLSHFSQAKVRYMGSMYLCTFKCKLNQDGEEYYFLK